MKEKAGRRDKIASFVLLHGIYCMECFGATSHQETTHPRKVQADTP
jgi:hypothetical protein